MSDRIRKASRWQRLLKWLCEAELIAHKAQETKVVCNTTYYNCERCDKQLDCVTTFSMRFQIEKLSCTRCGEQVKYQWNCCANDNRWIPLCVWCDIAVNEHVLKFFKIPDARQKLESYTKRLLSSNEKE